MHMFACIIYINKNFLDKLSSIMIFTYSGAPCVSCVNYIS